MSDYKWYLVHQLSWSYLFDVCIGLWKPVVLWPFYIGYSAGIFTNTVNSSVTVLLLIVVVLAIGMGFSVFISLLHRYMQVIPFSNAYRCYSSLWHRIGVYIIVVCLLLVALFLPLSLSFSLETDLKDSLTSKYPVLKRIFELHPSMIGYDTSVVEYSTAYGVLTLIVLFIVVVLVIVLYLNFIRILKRNKTHLSAGTYKLQLMLFKALFIQMLLAGVLLIFPITLCFILALLGFRWISSFALIAIFILGTHAFFDFIVLCYYVKAYRTYVKNLGNKMLRRLGFNIVGPAQPFVFSY
uniref:G_PROTEIN_RECEP_F1_2 domain-containing protein n=1 Tax=Panagrellus redivivus TaxID=6233 RepID=A0A7E4WC72_PANRE